MEKGRLEQACEWLLILVGVAFLVVPTVLLLWNGEWLFALGWVLLLVVGFAGHYVTEQEKARKEKRW